MFDTVSFEEGFQPESTLPVTLSDHMWQMKQVGGIPSMNSFKIRSDGKLLQKDDEGWIERKNTETGRFYKSIDDEFFSFEIRFENGYVKEITRQDIE